MPANLPPDHRAVPNLLGRWLPIAPPPFDLGVLDAFALAIVGGYGWMFYNGWKAHLPAWWLPVWLSIAALSAVNVLFPRVHGRHLFAWLMPLWRHAVLIVLAPLSWWIGKAEDEFILKFESAARVSAAPGANGVATDYDHRPEVYALEPHRVKGQRGGLTYSLARKDRRVVGRRTVLLPPELGRVLHANAVVLSDGIVDVSGVPGPAWLRMIASAALGKERLRLLIEIVPEASQSLRDPAHRAAALANRMPMWRQPQFPLSLHVLTRRRSVEDVEHAAGPESAVARDAIAPWLVKRRCILAVAGGTQAVLARRFEQLMPDLAQSGLKARRMFKDEVDELADDAWGDDRCPALTIAPRYVDVETGRTRHLAGALRSRLGVQRYVTFVVKGMRDAVPLGWTEPFTGGTLHADVAMYTQPKWGLWPELQLRLLVSWWGAIGAWSADYRTAAIQAENALQSLIAGNGAVLSVGLYVTVPIEQLSEAETALRQAVGVGNYFIPTYEAQQARASTEPFGRDLLHRHMTWTSDICAATNLAATSSIWPLDAEPVFFGVCGTAPEEIIGWDPIYEHDEAHVGFVAGKTGSGKTNLGFKLVRNMLRPHPAHRLARKNVRAVVVYFKDLDEWVPLCNDIGGLHLHPPSPLDAKSVALVTASGQPLQQSVQDCWAWLKPQLAAAEATDAELVAINLIHVPFDQLEHVIVNVGEWIKNRQRASNFTDPLLYWLDEAWQAARTAAGAFHIQQLALQSRADGIIFIAATQFLDHLLHTINGNPNPAFDVIRSATLRVFFRLDAPERRAMGEHFDLGPTALDLLAQIDAKGEQEVPERGLGIIQAHGRMAALRVVRLGDEERLGNTNPHERALALEAAVA